MCSINKERSKVWCNFHNPFSFCAWLQTINSSFFQPAKLSIYPFTVLSILPSSLPFSLPINSFVRPSFISAFLFSIHHPFLLFFIHHYPFLSLPSIPIHSKRCTGQLYVPVFLFCSTLILFSSFSPSQGNLHEI